MENSPDPTKKPIEMEPCPPSSSSSQKEEESQDLAVVPSSSQVPRPSFNYRDVLGELNMLPLILKPVPKNRFPTAKKCVPQKDPVLNKNEITPAQDDIVLKEGEIETKDQSMQTDKIVPEEKPLSYYFDSIESSHQFLVCRRGDYRQNKLPKRSPYPANLPYPPPPPPTNPKKQIVPVKDETVPIQGEIVHEQEIEPTVKIAKDLAPLPCSSQDAKLKNSNWNNLRKKKKSILKLSPGPSSLTPTEENVPENDHAQNPCMQTSDETNKQFSHFPQSSLDNGIGSTKDGQPARKAPVADFVTINMESDESVPNSPQKSLKNNSAAILEQDDGQISKQGTGGGSPKGSLHSLDIIEDDFPSESRLSWRRESMKNSKALLAEVLDYFVDREEEPVAVGHRLFRKILRTMEVTLSYGYYLGLVPFKIVEDRESYSLKICIPQMILTAFFLLASTALLILRAVDFKPFVNIADKPTSLFEEATKVMAAVLGMTYLYVICLKGRRFLDCFTCFNRRITSAYRPSGWAKGKIGLVKAIPLLLYFAIANWKVWGSLVYEQGCDEALNGLYVEGLATSRLSDVKNNAFFLFVTGSYVTVSLYTELWTYYIHALLWAAAITVFVSQRKMQRIVLSDPQSFNLTDGAVMFMNQRILIQRLNSAMGPLIVVIFLELVPFGVYAVCQFANHRLGFSWTLLALVPLKLFHILVAAEACSNADSLVLDIWIDYGAEPAEIKALKDCPLRTRRLAEHIKLVKKFKAITRRAICLRGMNFFDVSQKTIFAFGATEFGLSLMIGEWAREVSDPKKAIYELSEFAEESGNSTDFTKYIGKVSEIMDEF